MKRRIILAAVLMLPAGMRPSLIADGAPPKETLLFDSGVDGYPRYRIPALMVAKDGSVLAVSEGRKSGRGLTGDIDIVVKRSRDDGRTWQPLELVADDEANTLGNPCFVLDSLDGTLWLAMTRSFGGDTEDQIVSGTSRERTRVLITHSRDHGRTWSRPKDITAHVKKPSWTWYGTGPGTGVQLSGGRLVIPAYHVEESDRVYRSHVIFSDDHGATWKLGGTVGDNTSECHVVERRDGSLYLDARTVVGTELRSVAISRNCGQTWEQPSFHKELYDPHCQGCVIRLPARDGREPEWLFSNPAGPGRRNLTLRISRDEGVTWTAPNLLRAGDAQYSSLASLPDGQVGCLFESWERGNYRIYFARISR